MNGFYSFIQRLISFFTAIIAMISAGNSIPRQIEDNEPYIAVESIDASAGETVEVKVRIQNNPGIAGAKITVSYDPLLSLTSASCGTAFSCLQFTKPGKYANPCSFTWDSESGMSVVDGDILILKFKVDSQAKENDKLYVKCTYKTGDIFNEELDDVSLSIQNGLITVI